ncbi:MAG: 4Fe-4S binding protein [Chloroflexi bacterium]|nr:4Fe-4S binding protein [Chloroflexota bacterium]
MYANLTPVIVEEDCTGCASCIPACPVDALTMVDNLVAITKSVECDYCGECEAACPTGAITCPYDILVEG